MITGNENSRIVRIDGKYLDPKRSQKVYNHSPDGFAWGYSGSGPSQLALAILLEFADPETAGRYYQEFKAEVVAGLQGNFELDEKVVRDFVKQRTPTKLLVAGSRIDGVQKVKIGDIKI